MRISWLFFFLLPLALCAQEGKSRFEGKIADKSNGEALIGATVYFPDLKIGRVTDIDGLFQFDSIPYGNHKIQIRFVGAHQLDTTLVFDKSLIEFAAELALNRMDFLPEALVSNKKENSVYARLKNIEGTAIYAAKKNEIIQMDKTVANLSSNNARQVFSRIPGVNVWESDCAGLQLGVGARGLSPDRTSNFNTRQNGYDMAADALGYPESYYAPPMQAIERIEIVRGAASLQYGTQFGGMINLKLKKGNTEKKLSGQTINTYNSVGHFNTYNELGGQHKGFNYFGFINYRTGQCNRPNTDFYTNTNFIRLGFKYSPRLTFSTELTHMSYLAQQAGGLTDFQFEEDPYQSLRARNWFKVVWNLAALNIDFNISEKTVLNSKTFALASSRQALGFLSTPNRLDLQPYINRDLLSDQYRNIGNETRLLHRYRIKENLAAFLIGIRLYRGFTEKKQGFGSRNSDADFTFREDELKLKSDYDFPGTNIAMFAENIFNITERWSITPGLRYEYIATKAEGFYDSSVRIPLTGEIIKDSITPETRERARSVLLAGLGMSYTVNDKLELYGNFSQNYRAITFNDIRIVNPSAAVDPDLQDEKGFNMDLGIRGPLNKIFTIDAGLFWLSYNGRIGSVQTTYIDNFFGERIVRLTTNVADAEITGTELYLETDLSVLFSKKTNKTFSLNHFLNLAFIRARYHNSEEKAIEGKRVEAVPDWNLKTGLLAYYKEWKASFQFSYLSKQFSEATNAEISPTGVYGIIPAYWVMDLSVSWKHKNWMAEGGVNNITDNAYFTRRATGYPGPGIIPSAPRNFYLGVGYSF